MSRSQPSTPLPAACWILVCAFFNCAGWGLSAIHELNLAGYSVAVLAGLAALGIWRKRLGAGGWEGFKPHKLLRRFRRPFALGFLVLAALAFVGGALYAPVNYDSLAYRTPRVLNWLAEGQWHWIHTDFARVNTRTCGFEWISAPLIVFTGTDRLFFLINVASYLLLPGLIFSTLTRAGVKRRTAWHWMWIIPSSYCYLLQAGSIVNDMFGAVFALASLDFALRARQSGRAGEACLSVLAAALLTGAKASNLPLLLPWVVAFVASWRVWLRRPLMLGAVVVPAAFCSFLPTVVLNWWHCGDWTGLIAEHATHLIGHCPAWVRLVNNSVMNVLGNVVPPVFPFTSEWNHLADRLIPSWLAGVSRQHFETGPAHWQLDDLQVEENAGLGFGVTLLLVASLGFAAINRWRRPEPSARAAGIFFRMVCVAPWLGLAYTMSKLGLSCGARYLAPYYPLLIMGLLRGEAQAQLVKRKWWRACAAVTFVLALMLLVVTPPRPLWPAGWVLKHLGARLQSSHLGARAFRVYSVYGARAEAFAPIRDSLPGDEQVVGLVTFDDPETSLWRPFGKRRIRHVTSGDSAADLHSEGIRYVVVGRKKFSQLFDEPFESWLSRVNGKVVSRFALDLRAGEGPAEWLVVRLSPPAGGEASNLPGGSAHAGDQPESIKSSPPGASPVKVGA
jgi:hypothetical protein